MHTSQLNLTKETLNLTKFFMESFNNYVSFFSILQLLFGFYLFLSLIFSQGTGCQGVASIMLLCCMCC